MQDPTPSMKMKPLLNMKLWMELLCEERASPSECFWRAMTSPPPCGTSTKSFQYATTSTWCWWMRRNGATSSSRFGLYIDLCIEEVLHMKTAVIRWIEVCALWLFSWNAEDRLDMSFCCCLHSINVPFLLACSGRSRCFSKMDKEGIAKKQNYLKGQWVSQEGTELIYV